MQNVNGINKILLLDKRPNTRSFPHWPMREGSTRKGHRGMFFRMKGYQVAEISRAEVQKMEEKMSNRRFVEPPKRDAVFLRSNVGM